MYQPLITFCPHSAIFTQVLAIFEVNSKIYCTRCEKYWSKFHISRSFVSIFEISNTPTAIPGVGQYVLWFAFEFVLCLRRRCSLLVVKTKASFVSHSLWNIIEISNTPGEELVSNHNNDYSVVKTFKATLRRYPSFVCNWLIVSADVLQKLLNPA